MLDTGEWKDGPVAAPTLRAGLMIELRVSAEICMVVCCTGEESVDTCRLLLTGSFFFLPHRAFKPLALRNHLSDKNCDVSHPHNSGCYFFLLCFICQ